MSQVMIAWMASATKAFSNAGRVLKQQQVNNGKNPGNTDLNQQSCFSIDDLDHSTRLYDLTPADAFLD